MEETIFRQELQKRTAAIEELLKEYLPAEEGYQKTVIEAMNYSLMAGGKSSVTCVTDGAYFFRITNS